MTFDVVIFDAETFDMIRSPVHAHWRRATGRHATAAPSIRGGCYRMVVVTRYDNGATPQAESAPAILRSCASESWGCRSEVEP
jgi:hypothetical protein